MTNLLATTNSLSQTASRTLSVALVLWVLRLLRLISLALISLILSLGISPKLLAQRVLLDRVIAIVDEDVVLESELAQRLNDVHQAAVRAGQELPEESELQEELLETLILENLQLQFAERVSIRYDDDTINRVLANMASNNNMSFEQYIAVLEENDAYLLTREQVRKQLTIQELQRGVVNRRITITDQEIENFLNSESGREIMAAEYFVDHILVQRSETDSEDDVTTKRTYAAELAARIESGENLLTLRYNERNIGRFPITNTDFGWRKATGLPSLFADIVEDMDVGETEGPIEASNGFHVIQLVERRGGTEQMVEQTHLRHIMLAPNEIRTNQQSETEIAEFHRRIVAGEEDFASIARQHSDDMSSVVAGGDLDWISEDGLPPQMQSVVAALGEGELSEPFSTEAGWHLVEVLGRRVSDLSVEFARNQAELALRERKFDLELQNWLIEIREEAFVEYVN
ncbi:MAG: peptidylprolyl isomerase [Pseudohongiellaceae bacterium]